jgi:murein DD-endopeptidase MepM/ murein hydrolase activator NlpD
LVNQKIISTFAAEAVIEILMPKIKYRFNPESLKFDRIKTGVRRTVGRVFTFFTATLMLTIVYYWIYSPFFHTPKERVLLREIQQMEENYTTLTNNLQQIEDVLADIQQRDTNLYRLIFESEPVPQTILRAGFGEVNRYEALESYSNSELIVETTRRSEILSNQLQIQKKLMDDMLEKLSEKDEQFKTRPVIQPIENRELNHTSAGFGWRMSPFYRAKRFHEGMDFTAPAGTPVRATGDGEVVETQTLGAQGVKIVIDHGYAFKTVYAHLNKFNIKKGQKVTRGEIIGEVGSSGMSMAPHLHYEVHKNGKPVDPIPYFFNELSPAAYARIRDLSNLGRTFD